jgi:hypothetical protein
LVVPETRDEREHARLALALSVWCPKCEAPAGARCHDRKTWPRGEERRAPHAERFEAALVAPSAEVVDAAVREARAGFAESLGPVEVDAPVGGTWEIERRQWRALFEEFKEQLPEDFAEDLDDWLAEYGPDANVATVVEHDAPQGKTP